MDIDKMDINQKLSYIQTNLRVGKAHRNNFGKYNYRNTSDIFEGLKSLLKETKCYVTVSDEIICVGSFNYIKATAVISDGNGSISTTGWARESVQKKGMDDSQITGSTSSYARKYTLNGLFAIDDTEDADSMDNTSHETINRKAQENTTKNNPAAHKASMKEESVSEISNWDSQRNNPIPFGKYKGQEWGELPLDYIKWLSEKSDNQNWKSMANAEILHRAVNGAEKNIKEQEVEMRPQLAQVEILETQNGSLEDSQEEDDDDLPF